MQDFLGREKNKVLTLLLSPFALLGQLQNDQKGTFFSFHVSSI